MNNITRILAILATSFFICCYSAVSQRSQTFLTLRPPFQSGSPERESLLRYPKNRTCLSFIQVVPFGGMSINNTDIAAYFMPAGNTSLLATEDGAAKSEFRDLAASNFNVKTQNDTFRSMLKFEASQTIAGFGFAWRQQVANHWWIEIGAPFVHLENRMKFMEVIVDDGGGVVDEKGLDGAPYVANMTQAFKQPSWNFGKIDSKAKLVKEGIAFVELKGGYEFTYYDYMNWYGYLGFILPTGNKPTQKYVFEPILGDNGHYGFMYGSHLGVDVWEHNEHEMSFQLDINTRYMFRNEQIRSFDPKNKEFGRYLETYNSATQAEVAAAQLDPNSGTSGTNVFTQCVKVFPGFQFSFLTAFLYSYDRFDLEAGYNFYTRLAEAIEFQWDRTAQIKDVGGLGGTNEARTIARNFNGSVIPVDEYVPLTGRDIDLGSAASPAQLSYTFYVTGGYHVCEGELPTLVGGGAAYEVATHTGVSKWYLWGKIAVQY